jgi:hypothetical protein
MCECFESTDAPSTTAPRLSTALEAYVSAHLWDFPDDLDFRTVPGGVAGRLSLPPLR